MNRPIDLQAEGRFASALAGRMKERSLSIRMVAEQTGLTYEHIRKLVRGEAYPSRLALRELCRILALPEAEMQQHIVADRLEKKYGGIPHALAGKHPELSLLARWWDLLTPAQKDMFRIQIKSVAEANQKMAAERKPAQAAMPAPRRARLRPADLHHS